MYSCGSLQGATFHIERVIPLCKGGRSDLENLALACPGYNLHKAGRITAIDPTTCDYSTLSDNFGRSTSG
ncbi:MAG: HNH endonuclease [Terriglobia bacterium]